MCMFKKWIVPMVFIVGMIIFLYPIIGNWLSTKEHHTVMSKHNEELKQMTEEQKQKEQDKAKAHNESVKESTVPITDPFAEDAEEEMNHSGYYDVLNIGETMGSIEIPSLKVDLPIYHGVGEDVLRQGIGHMSNSSFPVGGKGTHTALTGHRGMPSSKLFRDLDKIQKDDVFYIHTLDETLAYKVDDIQIVLPSETSWLDMVEDKDYVTLITCEPYMINTHRLLVRGERTAYEPKLASTPTKVKNNNKLIYLLSVGLLVTLVTVLYYRRKMKMEE